jgi:predicted ArsR family transcriptional regulator
MTQLDMLYPKSPGFKEHETSKQAAEAMQSSAPRLRERVLACLRRGAMTPDEVADRMGMSVLSIRPRFTELARLGRIIDTGHRRANTSGRQAKVWRVTND